MLDIDNSDGVPHISIRDFIQQFNKYHFILYPSTNHMVKTDQNKIPIEKFRVIFPLDPQQYGNFNTIEKHGRLYSNVLSEFP